MTYTVGTLFSGIGVPDLAASLLGMEVLFHVEIEDFPRKVLESHAGQFWPNATLLSDVRTVGKHNLPYVDVLVGGFPCQDVSFAGKRAGMGEGTRTGLWREFARIIAEIQPRVVFAENVPGVLAPIKADKACFTPDTSTWFIRRAFVRRTVAPPPAFQVVAQLRQMGYVVRSGIIAASDFGAPHRRERWWCVAYADGMGRGGARRLRAKAVPDDEQRYSTSSTRRQLELHAAQRGDGAQLADAAQLRRQRRGAARRRRAGLADESAAAGYADGAGRREQRRAVAARAPQPAAQRAGAFSDELGNAASFRRRERRAESARPRRPDVGGAGVSRVERNLRHGSQPGVCRSAVGLADWLDGFDWPAHPGEPQKSWEPPRVIPAGLPNRAARLRALGNSMAFPVVYALLANIQAWLEAQDGVMEQAS